VTELLTARDGLIGGVCNGFQALVKLGLVPYGEIRDALPSDPTLTFNAIGRHQSRLVRVRVASNKSPWLMHETVGAVRMAPISHGEGRFIINPEQLRALSENGRLPPSTATNPARRRWTSAQTPTAPRRRWRAFFLRTAGCSAAWPILSAPVACSTATCRGKSGDTMFRGAVDYFR
jgi:phosphoribosylformylglycinamidine synthase